MSRRYQQEQRLELLTETALRMGAKWEKATVQLVLEELAQVSDTECGIVTGKQIGRAHV